MSNHDCPHCRPHCVREWLVLLRHDRISRQYHILPMDIWGADVRSYDALIRNGDALAIDGALNYICEERCTVAHEFRHIIPFFDVFIGAAIRNCTLNLSTNTDFSIQRCRFMIFDYFARMVARYLVSQNMTMNGYWSSHDDVLGTEADLMARWYEWFVAVGVHFDAERGFRAEARTHFRVIRDFLSDE